MATPDGDPNTPAEGYAGKNIHFLPKSYLKQAGINGAAVLYGFAIKLKGHKSNFHEGRYWYYETAENLCRLRWPYISPSALAEITDKLVDKGLLLKGAFNKASYDRTNWYSMDTAVRKAVLGDTLLWFDVEIAIQRGIPAGLVFHNLRYHLQGKIREHPTPDSIPYHEINKRQLARDLGLSESTVKRAIESLCKHGQFLKKDNGQGYTIPNIIKLSDLDGGEISNLTAKDSNEPSSSKADMGRSEPDFDSSNLESSRSIPENNTQCETYEKPVRNQCEKNKNFEIESRLEEEDFNLDYLNSKIISKSFCEETKDDSSSTPAYSAPDSNLSLVHSYKSLAPRSRYCMKLLANLTDDQKNAVNEALYSSIIFFAENHISYEVAPQLLESQNEETIIDLSTRELAEFSLVAVEELEKITEFNNSNKREFVYIAMLELLISAVRYNESPMCEFLVNLGVPEFFPFDIYQTIANPIADASHLSSFIKADIFLNKILERNQNGWFVRKSGFGFTEYDFENKTDLVSISPKIARRIESFFKSNSNLPASHLFAIFETALESSYGQEIEEEFDKFFYRRRSIDITYFISNIENVIKESDLQDVFEVNSI